MGGRTSVRTSDWASMTSSASSKVGPRKHRLCKHVNRPRSCTRPFRWTCSRFRQSSPSERKARRTAVAWISSSSGSSRMRARTPSVLVLTKNLCASKRQGPLILRSGARTKSAGMLEAQRVPGASGPDQESCIGAGNGLAHGDQFGIHSYGQAQLRAAQSSDALLSSDLSGRRW